MNALQKKVEAIYTSLDSQLVERSEILRGFIVAVLARKHLFGIGPPGTAKSLVGEKFCKSITNANYFEWLMGKFTKPEDIFGPVRVTKLKEDKYERNTTHQLPEAHIAFLSTPIALEHRIDRTVDEMVVYPLRLVERSLVGEAKPLRNRAALLILDGHPDLDAV